MSFFFDLTIYIYVYDLVILRYKTNEKTIFWEFVLFYFFIKCKIPLLDSPKYMYMIWWDRCQKKDSQKYMCVSCSHQFVFLTMIVFLCMMTVWRFYCLFQYTCIYISICTILWNRCRQQPNMCIWKIQVWLYNQTVDQWYICMLCVCMFCTGCFLTIPCMPALLEYKFQVLFACQHCWFAITT